MDRKPAGRARAEADHSIGGSELIRQSRGGALRPPYQRGQSGNPGGYSRARHVTNAYNRLLRMDAVEFDRFQPKTPAERIAFTMIQAASTPKNLRVDAAKEIVDRTEGKPATAPEDRELQQEANAVRRIDVIVDYLGKLGLTRGR